jgi:hypothetical protein
MTRFHPLLLLTEAFLGLALASASAQATFMVDTNATGVTYSGGSLTVTSLTAGSTFVVNGQTITVGASGGTSYLDSAGSTVYLLDDVRTAGTMAIPNEQIFVTNTTAGATDTGTFTFTLNIAVINNGATKMFTEGPVTIAMDLANGNSNYIVSAGSLSPPSQVVGGTTFVSGLPQGLSGDINSINNGGVSATISAVPEPSTVALLGVGAIMLFAPRLRRITRRLGQA